MLTTQKFQQDRMLHDVACNGSIDNSVETSHHSNATLCHSRLVTSPFGLEKREEVRQNLYRPKRQETKRGEWNTDKVTTPQLPRVIRMIIES